MRAPPEPLRAAVVIPLIAGDDPAVLFVRRAAHLRRNAGQVGFPGGLVDDADGDDLTRTALRELREELGIDAGDVALVYRLPDALVVNRSVLVAPFVGVLPALPDLHVDVREVERAFTVPLQAVAAAGALHEGIESFDGRSIPTWQLDYGDEHVWGATARMLKSLLDAVTQDADLRRELEAGGVTFGSLPADPMRRPSGTLSRRPV